MSDLGAFLRGLLVASLFFAPGCYKTHTLRPVELAKLDGYDERKPASQPHQVVDDQGEKVTYQFGDELTLKVKDLGSVAGTYAKIAVRDGMFRGQPKNGAATSLALSLIESAELTKAGQKRATVKIVLGVVLGAAVVVGLGFLIAALVAVGTMQPL